MQIRNSIPAFFFLVIFFSACGRSESQSEDARSSDERTERTTGYEKALEDIRLMPEEDGPPLVCRMDSAEKFERAQRLKEELFSRLLAIEELDGGYAMKFPPDEGMMVLIHEHVRTEWQCCPFFRFELHYPSDHDPLWVHFKGGPEVKEMLGPKMEELKSALKEK